MKALASSILLKHNRKPAVNPQEETQYEPRETLTKFIKHAIFLTTKADVNNTYAENLME